MGIGEGDDPFNYFISGTVSNTFLALNPRVITHSGVRVALNSISGPSCTDSVTGCWISLGVSSRNRFANVGDLLRFYGGLVMQMKSDAYLVLTSTN